MARSWAVHYTPDGDFWIKDIGAEDWYYKSAHGDGFRLLLEGKARHAFVAGPRVEDANLLAELQRAANSYIDSLAKAS
jgi:hypothetical protein